MKCKNLLVRKQKYKPYFYCKEFRRQIILSQCENCLKRNHVRNKGIKKKSNKQNKLEKSRFSIFTNNFNKCYYCGKENEEMDLHEVYGGSNRIRSIKKGFVIPLCRLCHSNEKIINYLRIAIQKEFEEAHTREEFIKITGKSYIKGDD